MAKPGMCTCHFYILQNMSFCNTCFDWLQLSLAASS